MTHRQVPQKPTLVPSSSNGPARPEPGSPPDEISLSPLCYLNRLYRAIGYTPAERKAGLISYVTLWSSHLGNSQALLITQDRGGRAETIIETSTSLVPGNLCVEIPLKPAALLARAKQGDFDGMTIISYNSQRDQKPLTELLSLYRRGKSRSRPNFSLLTVSHKSDDSLTRDPAFINLPLQANNFLSSDPYTDWSPQLDPALHANLDLLSAIIRKDFRFPPLPVTLPFEKRLLEAASSSSMTSHEIANFLATIKNVTRINNHYRITPIDLYAERYALPKEIILGCLQSKNSLNAYLPPVSNPSILNRHLLPLSNHEPDQNETPLQDHLLTTNVDYYYAHEIYPTSSMNSQNAILTHIQTLIYHTILSYHRRYFRDHTFGPNSSAQSEFFKLLFDPASFRAWPTIYELLDLLNQCHDIELSYQDLKAHLNDMENNCECIERTKIDKGGRRYGYRVIHLDPYRSSAQPLHPSRIFDARSSTEPIMIVHPITDQVLTI